MKLPRYILPLLVVILGWSCAFRGGPPPVPVPQEVIDAILKEPCTEHVYRDTIFTAAIPPYSIPKPPEPTTSIPFIRYDVAPRPVGGWEAIKQNVRYPEGARQAGIKGTVIVQAFIDAKGCVRETIIMKGIPGTGLDEAAIEAVKNTRFIPAFYKTTPVGVWISTSVSFRPD